MIAAQLQIQLRNWKRKFWSGASKIINISLIWNNQYVINYQKHKIFANHSVFFPDSQLHSWATLLKMWDYLITSLLNKFNMKYK